MVGYLFWLFHLLIRWSLFIEWTEASISSQYETKQERKWQQTRGVGNVAEAGVHVVILPYSAQSHFCFLLAAQQKPCSSLQPFPHYILCALPSCQQRCWLLLAALSFLVLGTVPARSTWCWRRNLLGKYSGMEWKEWRGSLRCFFSFALLMSVGW